MIGVGCGDLVDDHAVDSCFTVATVLSYIGPQRTACLVFCYVVWTGTDTCTSLALLTVNYYIMCSASTTL